MRVKVIYLPLHPKSTTHHAVVGRWPDVRSVGLGEFEEHALAVDVRGRVNPSHGQQRGHDVNVRCVISISIGAL